MSRIDLVVFGASGFTGKYTVKHLNKISKEKSSNFTWGVAGRNKEKILKALAEVLGNEDAEISKIPIIIADLGDVNSLNEMAKQAKVILNCCGPYRFYGEPVIKACVENKTHHVDVSGEPQYMERMQLEYHEKAKENGVCVVSACGFDSIPSELGLVFVKNEFGGEVNSAEMYLDTEVKSVQQLGSSLHYGTWESAVYGVGFSSELRPLRKKLLSKPLPTLKPKLQKRFPIFKSEVVKGKWCLPFLGSDRSVIRRSQYHFYQQDKERPTQVATYVTFPSIIHVMVVLIVAGIFAVLTKFGLGRKLLLQYPKLFSLGLASHEGPTEEQAEKTEFSYIIAAEGWKEKLTEPTDVHVEAPNKKLMGRVWGKNPGYGATCIFLIVSALVILEEIDNIPNKGGVYPPGAAFAKTSMIKRLTELGIKFEILTGNE